MSLLINIVSDKEDDDDDVPRKGWTDTNTRLLIVEYKKYYQQWKKGEINKKKKMWIKVADSLRDNGEVFTPEQVENRFKTLVRRYRKSSVGSTRRREFPLQDEFSDLIMEQKTYPDGTPVNINPTRDFFESVDTEDDRMFEDEEEISEQARPVYAKPRISRRARFKNMPVSIKPVKTTVDVLLEIKELMKKVEIRKQLRHDNRIKVALERNKLLKRKNELMERILLNTESF